MKKKYVRPESRLYAINLAENIASSIGGDISGGGSGGGASDSVQGGMIIHFTQSGDGCRGVYQYNHMATVTKPVDSKFSTFLREFSVYANQYPDLWDTCFTEL